MSCSITYVDAPGCNDNERLGTPYGDATVITSCFWSRCSIDEISQFVDPHNWETYGKPYWKKMQPHDAQAVQRYSTGDEVGFSGLFDEEVRLPVIGRVTAELDVRFSRSHDRVRVDYELARADDVTVDEGFIAVVNNPGPHGVEAFVHGQKVIRFTDPDLNSFPGLACDGGWVFLMINMALNGGGLHVAGVKGSPGPTAAAPLLPPSTVSGIDDAIDEWVVQAGMSLREHGATVKSAVAKVTGRRYDPHWINDLVGMGGGAVKATGNTLTALRRIVRELEKMGGTP